MKKTPLFKLSCMVAALIPALAFAEQTAQQLQTVNVRAKSNKKVNQERVTRDKIDREMIRDTRDLVRYSADVGVSESGRRMKGFAIRGVEDNRVGVSIDGVSLPDSEENSLYARYGNFNNSRLSIDPELVRSIEITKGSDSFYSGSGSLGGNVNYRTLDANDILLPERTLGGMVKSGYASKNREWVNTLGVGFQNDAFDVALMYSNRRGHETKSRGGDVTPWAGGKYDSQEVKNAKAMLGSTRINPDPMNNKSHGFLAKFGWNIAPEHRVALNVNGQKSSSLVREYSYVGPLTEYKYWREGDDRQTRVNTNLSYEFKPENSPLNKLKLDFDHQKTKNAALTYTGENARDPVLNTYIYNKKSDEPYATIRFYNRLNNNTFKRLSLQLESKPLTFLGGEHVLSLKSHGSDNLFSNINDDRELKLDGTLAKTYRGQPNPDVYTIQRPMQTKTYGISLMDKTQWNNTFSTILGLGYDVSKVKALDTQLTCGAWNSLGKLCVGKPEGATFKNWNGIFGLNAQLNNTWKVGSYVSSGYRVPNASELYFSFESAFGDWTANPKLKSERSVNYGINLQGKGSWGDLDVNLYQTRYRNFLYEREDYNFYQVEYCLKDPQHCQYHGINAVEYKPAQQMVNADKARAMGLELNGRLNAAQIHPKLEGWKLSGSMGYSKGKIKAKDGVELSMLSITPFKAVFGLDYESADGKWGVFNRISFLAGKKARDAQYAAGLQDKPNGACRLQGVKTTYDPNANGGYGDWVKKPGCVLQEQEVVVKDYPYLNKKSWVYDIFGYYKPTKQLTLRAGVYNVFNTKYHTWDTLRGINVIPATSNKVDKQLQGLERYYAPPRNFALSVEYKF